MKLGWCGGITKVDVARDVGCASELGNLVDFCFVFDLEDHLGISPIQSIPARSSR